MTRMWMTAALTAVVLGIGLTAAAQDTTPAAQQREHGMRGVSGQVISQGEFVRLISQHHRDGIAMAKIAERRAATPQVRSLATKIRQAQETELAEFQAFSQRTAATPSGTSGSDVPARLDLAVEMSAAATRSRQRVESASATAVDVAFVEEMSKHHQQGIDIVSQTTFQDPKLKELAQRMVTSHNRELQELQNARTTAR